MNGEGVGILMSAYDEMRDLIERATVGEPETFGELAQRARTLVWRFEQKLGAVVSSEIVRATTVPLVFWLDECVQRHWGYLGLNWASLQQSELQRSDGGDAFFEQLRQLLQPGVATPLVVVSYLLALREGFEGCCVDAPEELEAFRGQLVNLLPKLERTRVRILAAQLPRSRPIWWGLVPLVGLPVLVHLLVALATAIW